MLDRVDLKLETLAHAMQMSESELVGVCKMLYVPYGDCEGSRVVNVYDLAAKVSKKLYRLLQTLADG